MYALEFVNTNVEAGQWGTGSYRPTMDYAIDLDEAFDRASLEIATGTKGIDRVDILASARSVAPMYVVTGRGIERRHYRLHDDGEMSLSHRELVAMRWDASPAFD